MTDRELLELAAKAYWGDEIDDVVSVDWCDSDECIEFAHGDNQDHNGNDVWVLWDPLTDDGDALRLAVKLGASDRAPLRICIEYQDDGEPDFTCVDHFGESTVYHTGDPAEATRRAIVIAAAEIGKSVTNEH